MQKPEDNAGSVSLVCAATFGLFFFFSHASLFRRRRLFYARLTRSQYDHQLYDRQLFVFGAETMTLLSKTD